MMPYCFSSLGGDLGGVFGELLLVSTTAVSDTTNAGAQVAFFLLLRLELFWGGDAALLFLDFVGLTFVLAPVSPKVGGGCQLMVEDVE
jgi:hypothetical protein